MPSMSISWTITEGRRTCRMRTPTHPGEIVREECLARSELTVTEGAKVLGVTRQALNNLVNERAASRRRWRSAWRRRSARQPICGSGFSSLRSCASAEAGRGDRGQALPGDPAQPEAARSHSRKGEVTPALRHKPDIIQAAACGAAIWGWSHASRRFAGGWNCLSVGALFGVAIGLLAAATFAAGPRRRHPHRIPFGYRQRRRDPLSRRRRRLARHPAPRLCADEPHVAAAHSGAGEDASRHRAGPARLRQVRQAGVLL